jgi:exopolysaccharide biosynthesis protein
MSLSMRSWLVLYLIPSIAAAQWKVMDRQESDAGSSHAFVITVSDGSAEAKIHAVTGRPSELRFRVLNNGDRRFSSIQEAVSKSEALAGVNGGYFQPDLTPVGLLISQGKVIHPLERAKLLSGVFLVRKQKPALVRAQHFSDTAGISDAIQCGPFLVEGGNRILGLNKRRSAPRTFVFLTRGGDWGIGICRSVTLPGLSEILTIADLLPNGPITAALNLDGGSSTGFFLARGDQSVSSPEWTTVGSYLLLSSAVQK